MKTIFRYFSLILLLQTGTVLAQPIKTTAQASAVNGNSDSQIERWIAMSEQFDHRLLDTVYWSLSTVITVLIALVGFNWFTNSRAYEKDKISLSAALNAEINQEITRLRETLVQQHEDQLDKLAKLAKEEVTKQSTPVIAKITALDSKMASSIDLLREDFKELKIDALRAEGSRLEKQNLIGSAIARHIEIARISKDDDYLVGNAFSDIERLLKKGSGAGAWESELAAFLQETPSRYDTIKTRIRDLLVRVERP